MRVELFSTALLLCVTSLVDASRIPNVKRQSSTAAKATIINNAVVYVSCTLSYSAFAAVAAIPNSRKVFPIIPVCVALGVPLPASLLALQLATASSSVTSTASKTSTTITSSSIIVSSTSKSSSTSSSSSIISASSTVVPASYSSSSATPASPSVVPKSCRAGTYSSTGFSPCLACTSGSISTGSATICTICLAGTFASSDASVCTSCAINTFSASSALTCTSCAAGTDTVASTGQSSCTACPTGFFTLGSGAACSSCGTEVGACDATNGLVTACAEGFGFQNNDDRCLPCLAGTFSAAGSLRCSTCQGPSSFALAQASVCTRCTSAVDGSQRSEECDVKTGVPTDCTPGFGVSGSSCVACLAGTSAAGGSARCADCVGPINFALAKASVCTRCTSGVAGSQANAECDVKTGVPTDCTPGFGIVDQTCVACVAGTYASGGSGTSLACSTCMGPSSFALAQASACTQCTSGVAGSQANEECDVKTGVPTDCTPGFGIVGQTCVACLAGTYALGGSGTSLACKACIGTSSFALPQASTCTACTNPGDGSQIDSTCNINTGSPSNCKPGFEPNGLVCRACTNSQGSAGGIAVCAACTAGIQYILGGQCTTCDLGSNGYSCDPNSGLVNGCKVDTGFNGYQGAEFICGPCNYGLFSPQGGTDCIQSYVRSVSDGSYLGFVANSYLSDGIFRYIPLGTGAYLYVAAPTFDTGLTNIITFDGTSPGTAGYTAVGFVADTSSSILFNSGTTTRGFFSASALDDTVQFFNQPNDNQVSTGNNKLLAETKIWTVGTSSNSGLIYPLGLSVIDSSSDTIPVTSCFYFFAGLDNTIEPDALRQLGASCSNQIPGTSTLVTLNLERPTS